MILASFYYEYPTDYTLPVAGVLAAAFLVCIIRLGRIAAGMGVGFLAGLFLAVWVFSRGKGDMVPLMVLTGGMFGAVGGAVLGGVAAAIGRWRRKATQPDEVALTQPVSKARRMIGLTLRAMGCGLMIPPFLMLALYVAGLCGWSQAGIGLRKAGEYVTHFPVLFAVGLLLVHVGGWVRGVEQAGK